jgi:hypothetical protein
MDAQSGRLVPRSGSGSASLGSFGFRRPARPVNWRRLESGGLSLERVVKQSDASALLTHLDDVTDGAVSQQEIEVDPKLLKAFRLAQLSSQYLLFCQDPVGEEARWVGFCVPATCA